MFAAPRRVLPHVHLAHAHARHAAARLVAAFALALLSTLALSSATDARAQSAGSGSGSPDLVISQVYTRGGEAGATYRNDYIELFNRGSVTVDLSAYTLQLETRNNGSSTPDSVAISVASTRGVPVAPGQYILMQFASSGNNGAPLPVTPDFDFSNIPFPSPVPPINLGNTSGTIRIVKKDSPFSPGCPVAGDPNVFDYVGYGTGVCSEGNSPTPAPNATSALLRKAEGCTDTDNNASDFNVTTPNPRNTSSTKHVCPLGTGATLIQFSQSSYSVSETAHSIDITVNRTGDTSTAASVDYATVNGTATERQDYTTALGTLHFAPGETSKTFTIFLTDDGYPEGGDESLTLSLSNPSSGVSITNPGATLVIHDNDVSTPATNPIDDPQFFVRQHYHDFLNREPDAAGLDFWTNQIVECESRDASERQGCREVRRINVSAAFFLSIEFQETGYFVYRLYKAAFPESTARPKALPRYREFMRDTQQISRGVAVGVGDWQEQLRNNTNALVEEFVQRAEFKALYPETMTPEQYVDALNANTGGALSASERNALVSGLQPGGTETRASVLRIVAEDADFKRAEINRAFVLMEYFGYLRRNPNEAPEPTLSYAGYDFWLGKLNEFGGNYIQAEMVKAFITSPEYRQRFGSQ